MVKLHASAALPPGNDPPRGLNGPQSRSGRRKRISLPQREVELVVSWSFCSWSGHFIDRALSDIAVFVGGRVRRGMYLLVKTLQPLISGVARITGDRSHYSDRLSQKP